MTDGLIDGAVQGAHSAGLQVHEQVIDVLMSALKEHELAKGISDESLKHICIEAIEDDHINDLAWLEAKLGGLKTSSSPDNSPQEKENWEQVLSRIEPSQVQVVDSMEDLHEVLKRHEHWMASVLDPKREAGAGRANLQGACLQGFDLRYQNLSCADLRNANLMGANLEGANFTSAKLNSANLQGAILTKAKFRRADLTLADLRDAEWEQADWKGAILTGTILEGKVTSSKEHDITKPTLDSL